MSWFEKQSYCNDCHEPNHWWEGIIPETHTTQTTPLNGTFVKFDYNNYTPRQLNEKEIAINNQIAEYNNLPLTMKITKYIAGIFSMQKDARRIFNEKKHEYAWKDSGVKSWRELFNLD